MTRLPQLMLPLLSMLSFAAVAQDEGNDEFVSDLINSSIAVPQSSERTPRPEITHTPPPNVPSNLDVAPDVTMELLIRLNGEETTRTVTRTTNFVHVDMPDEGLEWFFMRNPVDARRANGRLVRHEDKAILYHNDIDLRDRQVARGWVDVMTVGIRLEQFDGLERTGESKEEFGLTFYRYVRDADSTTAIDEVWWHEPSGLPLQIFASNEAQSWEQELRLLHTGVDPAVLQDPVLRFPAYRDVDTADFGEEFHDSH